MRPPFSTLVLAVAGACVTACDAVPPSATLGCPVEAHSPSDEYDLSYQLTSPEPCPATLSERGQMKEAAALIVDGGIPDVYSASVEVTGRLGNALGYRVTDFQTDAVTRQRNARPQVGYRAGTGLPLSDQVVTPDQINQEYDVGRFEAWAVAPVRPGNPYGTVRITYRASGMMANLISGPRLPLRNSTVSWEASARGGIEPYSYRWFRDGTAVGTGKTYTAGVGTSPFALRVEITDAGGNMRAAAALIDVDGVEAALQGPQVAYGPNGETWQATGEGGYPPYRFEWFRTADDGTEQWVGTGAQWSGYPGDGVRHLRVRMTDAEGASSIADAEVTGVATNGQCQPVPPQLTCES